MTDQKDIQAMVDSFSRIKDERIRRKVLELVRLLASKHATPKPAKAPES